MTAVEQYIAARTVFSDVVEHHGTTGHVDQRFIGQHHIACGVQRDFAARQHHRRGQAKGVALEGKLATVAVDRATRAAR